jgi:hypothetical protein
VSSFIRAPRRDTQSPRISIVIPALNEAANLAVVLPQLPDVHEVILVDGGSADITLIRALGNRGLNAIFNLGFGTRYSDLCHGYNAFWADLLPVLGLPDHTRPPARDGRMRWGDGFEIETVINCRFAAAGVEIVEVPSVDLARMHGESNLNAVTDGLRVLRTLATEWLRSRLGLRHPAHGPVEWEPVAEPAAAA